MGLKPKKIAYDFEYHCDKCGAETWRSYREVQVCDKGVCICGHTLHFDLIEKVKRKIVYKVVGPKAVPTAVAMPTVPKKPKLEVEFKDAIAALKVLGFKHKESVNIVTDTVNDGVFGGNMDEFIKYLITTQV